MSEGTNMTNSRAALAEQWAASKMPNKATPEPPAEQSHAAAERHKRFVPPGAVLRAGVAKRAAAKFLRW